MLPAVVKTYAPRGQTPILTAPLNWEHLSVICALTPDGKLYIHLQEQAFNSICIVRFLKHLLRHITGKLLVIWDGLPAHRSRVIRQFLSEGGTQRIHLEQLPGYAPDLNPAEGVWQYLKYVELKNLCTFTIAELKQQLRKAIARLRHKTHILLACIEHVHLGQELT